MEKINIAVIGCSAIADKTVIPTLVEHPSFNLVMVGSRSAEKGKKFADKFACQLGSYEDVLSSPEIDAVYISVPSGLHYYWGKKVLEAGKHLLLEKPFTDNYQNAQDLIQIAENRDLIAMEALPYVYHPYFEKLIELLALSTIGDVRLIESSFGFPFLPPNDIRNNAEIGGGAILDNLIYPLSISINLLGDDIVSKSFRIIFNHETKIDERGFLRLDWENVSANINFGFGFSYKNCVEIWGSEGSIFIDRAFTKPATMDAEIRIKKNNTIEVVTVAATNQFYMMVDAFFKKIIGLDKSNKNEKSDILTRMTIISEMYQNCNKQA